MTTCGCGNFANGGQAGLCNACEAQSPKASSGQAAIKRQAWGTMADTLKTFADSGFKDGEHDRSIVAQGGLQICICRNGKGWVSYKDHWVDGGKNGIIDGFIMKAREKFKCIGCDCE